MDALLDRDEAIRAAKSDLCIPAPSLAGGPGGDIRFYPGKGGRVRDVDGEDGAIILFDAQENEWLRLESDGRAFVRGELVETNVEVWRAFRGWLGAATGSTTPPEGDGQPAQFGGSE